jgi:hypothetical protein
MTKFACARSLVEFAPLPGTFPSDLFLTQWLRAEGDVPSQVSRERRDLGVDVVGTDVGPLGCLLEVIA